MREERNERDLASGAHYSGPHVNGCARYPEAGSAARGKENEILCLETMERWTDRDAGAWKLTFMDCVTPTQLISCVKPSTTSGVLQQLFGLESRS